MNKKVVGMLVCMLLLITVVPVIGNEHEFTIVKEQQSNIDDKKSDNLGGKVDWWAMYHHDSAHTGYSSSLAPYTNHLRWTGQADYFIDLSSPAVVNDKLYIGTSEPIWQKYLEPNRTCTLSDILKLKITSTQGYGLYCFNANNGTRLWEFPTAYGIESSPAVVDNRVYFTSSDFDGDIAMLYCLDAESGEELWHDAIDNFSWSSPAVVDGFVYVSSIDIVNYLGNTYCYNAITGNRTWNFSMEPYEYSPLFGMAPAVANDMVYITSFNEQTYQGTTYCLNAATGKEKWHFHPGLVYELSPSPVVADGKVFTIGTNDINYKDRLYCLNATTGESIWIYYTASDEFITTTPACDTERIYFATLDGNLLTSRIHCAYIQNGTAIWQRTLEQLEIIFGAPAVADGKLYIASWMYGILYCYETSDGGALWQYQLGFFTASSPAIANERVYVADTIGTIYAFEDILKIGKISGGILCVKVEIKNIGESDFINVTWTIDVTGGLFGKINKHAAGIIPILTANNNTRVRAVPIFGFGKITIAITAHVQGIGTVKRTVKGWLWFIIPILQE